MPTRDHDEELVTVYETDNPALLPVIRSVLAASGLPFTTRGEESFGLLPVSNVSGPFSEHGLAVRFQVPARRADEARALLARIDGSMAPAEEEAGEPGDESP